MEIVSDNININYVLTGPNDRQDCDSPYYCFLLIAVEFNKHVSPTLNDKDVDEKKIYNYCCVLL